MTSPSPRKLQTIRWSTRLWNKPACRYLPALLCSLSLQTALADEPPATSGATISRSASEGQRSLLQLRERSPESRWKAISKRFAQPAPTPVPQRPQTAPTATAQNFRPETPVFDFSDEGRTFRVSGNSQPIRPVAMQPLPTYDRGTSAQTENIRSPEEMKKVTDIKPYFDYEPDPTIAAEDPCKNLCPRPEDLPCDPDSTQICPEEVQLTSETFEPRVFSETLFQWQASNLWHQPLYFEDPSLERYGHTHHALVQPFVSVGRFGLQLVGLPYQTVLDPYDCPVYTLGWYRPGDHAPRKYYQIPWNSYAALFQAEVMTGMFYIFP